MDRARPGVRPVYHSPNFNARALAFLLVIGYAQECALTTLDLAKECLIMDETLRELHRRYVAALQFYNSRPEERPGRSAPKLQVLCEEEFPAWWAVISAEEALQKRWLERFADPAAALLRARQRITEELHRIPIGRAAA